MNQLPLDRRIAVLSALTEGMSIRATVRMTGVAKNTIVKLLAELGLACGAYHNATVRNLRVRRVQCDEIWSFVGAKQKNVSAEKRAEGWGDVWTWTAIDAETKLMISWFVGQRDPISAWWFIRDVCSRLVTRVQLTTDGLNAYLGAVEEAFAGEIDYAMLVKVYGGLSGGLAKEQQQRYSPAPFKAAIRKPISGDPDPGHISTSYVERSNLTMRMSMRRFTRLTNGFSKKVQNHMAAIAVYYVHYNFCRVHQTLKRTPAMAAGLSDHPWELREMIALLGNQESAVA
jgi:IS1 family transposase